MAPPDRTHDTGPAPVAPREGPLGPVADGWVVRVGPPPDPPGPAPWETRAAAWIFLSSCGIAAAANLAWPAVVLVVGAFGFALSAERRGARDEELRLRRFLASAAPWRPGLPSGALVRATGTVACPQPFADALAGRDVVVARYRRTEGRDDVVRILSDVTRAVDFDLHTDAGEILRVEVRHAALLEDPVTWPAPRRLTFPGDGQPVEDGHDLALAAVRPDDRIEVVGFADTEVAPGEAGGPRSAPLRAIVRSRSAREPVFIRLVDVDQASPGGANTGT